jgi:hypothetical protein
LHQEEANICARVLAENECLTGCTSFNNLLDQNDLYRATITFNSQALYDSIAIFIDLGQTSTRHGPEPPLSPSLSQHTVSPVSNSVTTNPIQIIDRNVEASNEESANAIQQDFSTGNGSETWFDGQTQDTIIPNSELGNGSCPYTQPALTVTSINSFNSTSSAVGMSDSCNSETQLLTPVHTPSNTLSKTKPKGIVPYLAVCKRKLMILSPTRPAKTTADLKAWLSATRTLLDPFLSEEQCWLHPTPLPPYRTPTGLRTQGKISKRFTFPLPPKHNSDAGEKPAAPVNMSITLPYGAAHHIIYRSLTKRQIDGWVYRSWHASHLCGNWSCVNPEHIYVEDGAVNLARNACFMHRQERISSNRFQIERK